MGNFDKKPVYSIRPGKEKNVFGYVSPFEKRPDLGSYTPKTKRNPTFALMRKPTQKAEASLEFFETRKTLKSLVGPSSYMNMPNI